MLDWSQVAGKGNVSEQRSLFTFRQKTISYNDAVTWCGPLFTPSLQKRKRETK